MKKLLMTTTALIALGGVTSALADISISGNARWTYDTWTDKTVDTAGSGANNTSMGETLQLWFSVDETADSGLTYGANIRFRETDGRVDRNWIHFGDDWGKVSLGRQFSPFTTGSLGANWRGTISGVQPGVGDVTGNSGLITDSWVNPSGTAPKFIYNSPNIAGITLGFSMADGGTGTGKKPGLNDEGTEVIPVNDASKGGKADSTAMRVNYSTDIMDGTGLTLGYAAESTKAKDSASDKTDHTEVGAAVTSGDLTASVIQLGKTSKPKTGASTSDQKATELEVAYAMSDALTVNVIMLNSKENKGKKKGDKFSSTELGAKYTIAPGLTANLIYTKASHTPNMGDKNTGNSTRLQMRLNF